MHTPQMQIIHIERPTDEVAKQIQDIRISISSDATIYIGSGIEEFLESVLAQRDLSEEEIVRRLNSDKISFL